MLLTVFPRFQAQSLVGFLQFHDLTLTTVLLFQAPVLAL